MKRQKLTKKQLEVMKVLWNSSTPMISSEIEKSSSSFKSATVQACLRELIKKEYIKVADIVYSGTVLTRSYTPVFTKDEYFNEEYQDIIGSSSFSLCASLIETKLDSEELEDLEKLIARKKEELRKG